MTTAAAATEYRFTLERLGVVMRGSDTDPDEAWGVLNPAVTRTREGELLLYPRVVAEGNYSRVGLAKVLFDEAGDPCGVERLGYAIEPDEPYERNERTAGCEDARVTFIPAIDSYVMAYCAYGPTGPRVALAVSEDAREWRKLGPVRFADERGIDWNVLDNKDAFFFPEVFKGPDGEPALAFVHRPAFTGQLPEGCTEPRPGIWLSYVPLAAATADLAGLCELSGHAPVAFSEQEWEHLKIGGGTQPVRLADGHWLAVYHGVSGRILENVDHQPDVHYRAGVMVHAADDPTRVLYRSAEPILAPELGEETSGIVDNVVFPTALDDRGDGRIDVYYGMADSRIGVAKLIVSLA